MKISLLQMDVALANPEKNREKIEWLAAKAMEDTPDVLVLPEMWNIGFFPREPRLCADGEGQMAKAFLSELAKRYGVYVVGGSVASIASERLYNVSYVADRSGAILAEYRKMHLFSPSGEHKVFQAGSELAVFSLDGVKAAVVLCYDIRFCELIRLLALEGVSILFVAAAWPRQRLAHWRTLLAARAIENQMFVAAVNGCGRANELLFGGASTVLDPWGQVLAVAGETETVLTATVDFEALQEMRQRIHVFNDRRDDVYDVKLRG